MRPLNIRCRSYTTMCDWLRDITFSSNGVQTLLTERPRNRSFSGILSWPILQEQGDRPTWMASRRPLSMCHRKFRASFRQVRHTYGSIYSLVLPCSKPVYHVEKPRPCISSLFPFMVMLRDFYRRAIVFLGLTHIYPESISLRTLKAYNGMTRKCSNSPHLLTLLFHLCCGLSIVNVHWCKNKDRFMNIFTFGNIFKFCKIQLPLANRSHVLVSN